MLNAIILPSARGQVPTIELIAAGRATINSPAEACDLGTTSQLFDRAKKFRTMFNNNSFAR